MPMLELRLKSEFIALNDLLKATGVAHSGGAGEALDRGRQRVRVDGAVELRKTCEDRRAASRCASAARMSPCFGAAAARG